MYEAKMIHQFDHRWATYIEDPDKPDGLNTEDVVFEQKTNPAYAVQPRYWVAERQVLARIARVPARVSQTWLGLYDDTAEQLSESAKLSELLLALAQWVAGELFYRAAGAPISATSWPLSQVYSPLTSTEAQL